MHVAWLVYLQFSVAQLVWPQNNGLVKRGRSRRKKHHFLFLLLYIPLFTTHIVAWTLTSVDNMESSRELAAPLLVLRKSGEQENNNGVESTFCQEFKRVSSMAAPMVAVTVSQYLLQVVSLMMVGHLGILVSFSGVAIATSFAEVTGFSVLVNIYNSSFFSLFHSIYAIATLSCFSQFSLNFKKVPFSFCLHSTIASFKHISLYSIGKLFSDSWAEGSWSS